MDQFVQQLNLDLLNCLSNRQNLTNCQNLHLPTSQPLPVSNLSQTENGDKAFSTSGSTCLDFFVRITRNAPIADYYNAFAKAWNEDVDTAIRLLMNLRDVRSGKGEKLIPIVILFCLKFKLPAAVYEDILRKMVQYGYWKDLLKIHEFECRYYKLIDKSNRNKKLTFLDNPIELRLFAEQLDIDRKIYENEKQNHENQNTENKNKNVAISLCAKWAPTEKGHFDHHPMFAATKLIKLLGTDAKTYRTQYITPLRKHLNILETLMATGQLEKIDFSKIPSIAMNKMKHAFRRDCNSAGVESEPRQKLHLSYQKYLEELAKGKTKINVKGIQPHELVSYYLHGGELDSQTELQWSTIIDNIKKLGTFRNATAVVDVSGSMEGQPMCVSIALGLVLQACVQGTWHGQVITFSETPTWHMVTGSNMKEQVSCLKHAPWGGSTNLRAVFDMILERAINAKLEPDEMVKTLFIFTDMQFDSAVGKSWESTLEYGQRIFTEKGYEFPKIVCWNLKTSDTKTIPLTTDTNGYVMLSGFSTELLKCVMTGEEFNPISMMKHVLEPYDVPSTALFSGISNINFTESDLALVDQAVKSSEIKKAFKQVKTELETDLITVTAIANADNLNPINTNTDSDDDSSSSGSSSN